MSERAVAVGTEPHVAAYDRSTVSPGIVHTGVGGFHRSHQAMYIDELIKQGAAREWGIVGAGTMPGDKAMRDAMADQDFQYALVQRNANGSQDISIIGSILDIRFAPDDPGAMLELLTDPAVRIVSLTITEGGYHVHPVTGELDTSDEALSHDIDNGGGGDAPRSAFGFVLEALRRRRDAGTKPFTVMSCDNLPGNGNIAGRMLTAFAERSDADLAAWVRENVRFPNSMVDRITPATTDADREALAEDAGIIDAWPVVCEPFHQWVIEDKFSDGRPPLEDVGVLVVPDVEPYELMKLRLLNCGHQAIGYLGYLAGLRMVHEAAQDDAIAQFLRGYITEEAIPTVPPVEGVDLAEYRETLLERFSNPEVKDTLARLCAEASDRIPTWLVPVIRANLEANRSVSYAALIVAAWARYAEGRDEQGEPIEVVDRVKDRVMAAAAQHDDDPLAFLRNEDLFGDLVEQKRFTDVYQQHLERLRTDGARAALDAHLAEARADTDTENGTSNR